MKIALLILCIYAAYKIVKGGYLSGGAGSGNGGALDRVKTFLKHVF